MSQEEVKQAMESGLSSSDPSSPKNILKGSILILISNLIYISNSYIVAWAHLIASEVALVRGCVQVLLFGALLGKTGGKQTAKIECKSLYFYDLKCFFNMQV